MVSETIFPCAVIIVLLCFNRDLRLALVTSLVLTTAIYVFANIAYAVVLSKEEMLASPAVAVVIIN